MIANLTIYYYKMNRLSIYNQKISLINLYIVTQLHINHADYVYESQDLFKIIQNNLAFFKFCVYLSNL